MKPIVVTENIICTLGEGPMWSAHHGKIFWVDIFEGTVHGLHIQTGETESWAMGARASVVVEDADYNLLVVCQNSNKKLNPLTGKIVELSTFEEGLPNNRPNDGKLDPKGRLWFGTTDHLEQNISGSIYMLDNEGRLHKKLTDFGNPNTFAWSPDGTIFYLADSVKQTMWAFDFSLETGGISNRREFFSLAGTDIIPDGSAVDAEGYLWNAQWNGWRIVRYAPDGSVDRIIEMPVSCPTSCAFGENDLDILYVTSARKGQTEAQLAGQPDAGKLFKIDAKIPGVAVGSTPSH
ncbi:SMP-30/gluconolactonase/LRE family protein [Kordiimonas laminariae]|uniref:SMP-30/gluconolactonase/LRE family protein n=1 Tax=Kordiimonas laminariae TaxID=2917717 RepID=UPI001FF6DE44|nr:SMP-30/gluconolactonase/LRE family protein [Kordiimonas laminariae]MCK0068476.1 SMP-30/gluconolactonase/LRE family protein [Kordiimonas laminariae]